MKAQRRLWSTLTRAPPAKRHIVFIPKWLADPVGFGTRCTRAGRLHVYQGLADMRCTWSLQGFWHFVISPVPVQVGLAWRRSKSSAEEGHWRCWMGSCTKGSGTRAGCTKGSRVIVVGQHTDNSYPSFPSFRSPCFALLPCTGGVAARLIYVRGPRWRSFGGARFRFHCFGALRGCVFWPVSSNRISKSRKTERKHKLN